jgi:CYTH domain-containing protein
MRYEIPWRGLLIEIDVYRGKHSGLVVAEVEFPTLRCAENSNRRDGSAG